MQFIRISWNIKFSPLKSQLITFGGCNPAQCVITISGNSIPWVPKVKYLGIMFLCNTAITDLSEVCRNFYGKFNSIMYVLGKCSNEMVALHLLKTYTAYQLWCMVVKTVVINRKKACIKLMLLRITAFGESFRDVGERVPDLFSSSLPISFLVDQRLNNN